MGISGAPNFWTPESDAPKTSITGSVPNIWGMLGLSQKNRLVKVYPAYYTAELAYIAISAAPNFWIPSIDAPKHKSLEVFLTYGNKCGS